MLIKTEVFVHCAADSDPSTQNEDKEATASSAGSARPGPSSACLSSNPVEQIQTPQKKQVILKSYPKSSDGRSFNSRWFSVFPWIEYDVEKDAVFCYYCRTYGTAIHEKKFTVDGFRSWKNAMTSDKGLPKHEKSQTHKVNYGKHIEKANRSDQNTAVSTLVNKSTLEKHRYYVASILDVIRFITSHELSLRGTYNISTHSESGIFQSLFEYTIKKDERLAECVKTIPKNASYLSPEIQNEMIGLMAAAVKKSVATRVMEADVPFFTLMVDGTKEKNMHEAISICLRYIKCGKRVESCLSIENAMQLDAKYTADLILKTLSDNNIASTNLLSQCYDGASVMSGSTGGVQAKISEKLGRSIPYVHCFNHKLHLIIKHVVSVIKDVDEFFTYCNIIHKILGRFKFKVIYEGAHTSRLLEQRWTGHLVTAERVYENFNKMVSALQEALQNPRQYNFDDDDIVECRGLLSMMSTPKFKFILCATVKMLRIIAPADKILQKEDVGLLDGIPVIKSVYSCLEDLRSDGAYQEILSDSQSEKFKTFERDGHVDDLPYPRPKSKITPNTSFDDFVLTSSSGIYSNEPNHSSAAAAHDFFKQIFFEMIDTVTGEFDRRFFDPSFSSFIKVIDNVKNFDYDELKCLEDFRITVPTREELMCVKRHFQSNNIKDKYLEELYKLRVAFKETYEMMAAVETFGCSSARCEESFSTLTRILTQFRRSMTFQRESDLSLLSFEKEIANEISNDALMKLFNEKGNRRLQLY